MVLLAPTKCMRIFRIPCEKWGLFVGVLGRPKSFRNDIIANALECYLQQRFVLLLASTWARNTTNANSMYNGQDEELPPFPSRVSHEKIHKKSSSGVLCVASACLCIINLRAVDF